MNQILEDIQQSLFDTAKQKRDACIQVARTWEEFVEELGQKKMILAPWCDEEVWFNLILGRLLPSCWFVIEVISGSGLAGGGEGRKSTNQG